MNSGAMSGAALSLGAAGVWGGGDFAGAVPVTAVEPVPAHPQQAGADSDHRQVVRRVDLSISLQARSDHRRGDEPGDPGREMDDVG